MTRRIVILGSGFAGLWAALGAARRRAELNLSLGDLEIVTVTRAPFHDIRVRNYEADLATCRIPLEPMLAAVDVRLVVGEVERIDVERGSVQVDSGSSRILDYDRLVVALGSRLVRSDVPGLAQFGFDIDTYDAASRLGSHLRQLAESPVTDDGARTVVIVGAGLTGIEVATEMVSRLANLSRETAMARPRVLLVDHHPDVGSDMGESARVVIASSLNTLGVETRTGVKVVAVHEDGVTLDSGETIETATVLWCAGMQANPLVAQLPVDHDRFGRVAVDDYLRVPDLTGVFAAGDVARAPIDGEHASVMSCQHSRPMGRFAGCNVVNDLLGMPMKPLRIPWYVTVLDLGAEGAVYTEGWDRQVVATGDTAKTTKRVINTQRIYPPTGVNRAALLAAAAPVVQMPPAYGAAPAR